MQEAEGSSSIPIIPGPNLGSSKVPQGPRINTRTLQPPTSVQELTTNLPQILLVCQESAIIIIISQLCFFSPSLSAFFFPKHRLTNFPNELLRRTHPCALEVLAHGHKCRW